MDSGVVQHATNVLEFVSGRASRPGRAADLNPAIAGSWRRCALDYSIDPARHYAPCVARCRFAAAPARTIRGPRADRFGGNRLAVRLHRQVRLRAGPHRCERSRPVREDRRDAGGHVPERRADVRRGLERASRGNEWHRHLHRRKPVGDRAPWRTLSFLSHRPVLFGRTHSGSDRFAGGGSGRLHVERAIHARRRRAHDGAGQPVRALDRKISVPAALPGWRRIPLPCPAGVREPAARRSHRACAGCHDRGGRRDRDAIAACGESRRADRAADRRCLRRQRGGIDRARAPQFELHRRRAAAGSRCCVGQTFLCEPGPRRDARASVDPASEVRAVSCRSRLRPAGARR